MNLELEDYQVVWTKNGREAVELFSKEKFDLILLDIMLPGLNGIEVCEQVRLHNPTIPILMLSAKGEPKDRIKGLKTGADDYLSKPFILEELLIRIQKLLQRTNDDFKGQLEYYEFGENKIDFKLYEAKGPKGTFRLTKKEVLLLRLLIERKNQVVSRKEILQSVWGYDVIPSTRTIDNFILMLRKNFEINPASPEYFISIRGVGYKFVEN